MYRLAALTAFAFLMLVPSAFANSVSGAFVSIGADQTIQADPTPHPQPTTPHSQEVFGYTICQDPATFPQGCGPGSPQEGAGQPPEGYVVSCDQGFVYVSYSAFAGTISGLGAKTVTCHAFDPAGADVGTGTITYTMVDDTGPAFFGTNDVTVRTPFPGFPYGFATFTTPTAQDNVDGTRPVTCDHRASGDIYPLGDTLVTCLATDASGNRGAGYFYVHVTN